MIRIKFFNSSKKKTVATNFTVISNNKQISVAKQSEIVL